jgi:hypothetical protein
MWEYALTHTAATTTRATDRYKLADRYSVVY